jgi:dihydroflavonol-4-reductase
MRVFITGATGFIGANLLRLLLQQGYEVRALVRPTSRLDNLRGLDVEIVKGDLNNPDLWQLMVGCQVLFHVAAHYSLWQCDRDQLYDHNVLGTRNVLGAARKANIERSVYTSSVAAICVGMPPGTIVDETHQSPLDKLVGHYKKSKFLAEQEAWTAVEAGLDVVVVNPSSPIGSLDIKPTPTGDIILRFLGVGQNLDERQGAGFCKTKALCIIHSNCCDFFEYGFIFDKLSNGLKTHHMSNMIDGFYHCQINRLIDNLLNECAINF